MHEKLPQLFKLLDNGEYELARLYLATLPYQLQRRVVESMLWNSKYIVHDDLNEHALRYNHSPLNKEHQTKLRSVDYNVRKPYTEYSLHIDTPLFYIVIEYRSIQLRNGKLINKPEIDVAIYKSRCLSTGYSLRNCWNVDDLKTENFKEFYQLILRQITSRWFTDTINGKSS